MKRCVMLLLVLALSAVMGVPVSADTEDFHFSDFTGDYYLSKDAEGISHLKVVEQLTAEFPNYEQNKGICRQIPYTNQNGINVTLPNLDHITVTRNGAEEPIYSLNKYRGHYEVCTGDESYVLGTQVYELTYEFEKVVTDFGNYQELYWDTNGNGWSQRFDKLTARVHLDEEIWTGESWCYVGKYGGKGTERCETKKTGDGVEFTTENLRAGENLTFDVELKPGSFVVPEPGDNYILIWALVAMAAIGGLLLISPIRKYRQAAVKIREYRGMFVAPQYQPSPDHGIAEMAEVYLGGGGDKKVGMLLDLIVRRKIEIKRNEGEKKSREWELIMKDVENLEPEETILLELLNGGGKIKNGDVVAVRRHTATAALAALGSKFDRELLAKITGEGLVEKGYKIGDSRKGMLTRETGLSLGDIVSVVVLAGIIGVMAWAVMVVVAEVVMDYATGLGGRIIGEEAFLPVSILIIVVVTMTRMLLKQRASKYANYTTAGLKASNYMEGLKLYIGMAEAERMKFLQSVEGVDKSGTGIVKLYEKLLPYAAVFGLEESWMREMEQYCRTMKVETPEYLLAGVTTNDLSRTMRSAAGYANSATHYVSSSVSGGGGWSSGGSGGGGGGFSGGGGGGGGGGGR